MIAPFDLHKIRLFYRSESLGFIFSIVLQIGKHTTILVQKLTMLNKFKSTILQNRLEENLLVKTTLEMLASTEKKIMVNIRLTNQRKKKGL